MLPFLVRPVQILVSVLSLHAAASLAAAPGEAPALPPDVTLKVRSLTPKFLAFFAAAQAATDDSADTRWRLWKEKYDFAAVPPTPEGDAIARRMLDEAWPRYRDALPAIQNAGARIESEARESLAIVHDRLRLDRPLRTQVLLYVGGFEGNAFTAPGREGPVVAVPAEITGSERRRLLAHELTHVVHIALGNLTDGWERSIAETIVSEGLAMHVARAAYPGQPDAAYVEHQPGWLARAEARRAEILRGVVPHLETSDSATVFRFTMGEGPNGLAREAYYAGWVIVGTWLAEGESLADIARLPRAAMAERLRTTIARLTAAK